MTDIHLKQKSYYYYYYYYYYAIQGLKNTINSRSHLLIVFKQRLVSQNISHLTITPYFLSLLMWLNPAVSLIFGERRCMGPYIDFKTASTQRLLPLFALSLVNAVCQIINYLSRLQQIY